MERKTKTVKQKIERTAYTRTIQQTKKSCPMCGREFWGSTVQQYCSQNCRIKGNYARHAEKYRKARMAKYYKGKK